MHSSLVMNEPRRPRQHRCWAVQARALEFRQFLPSRRHSTKRQLVDREQENLKWLVLCLLDELATKLASKRFAAFIVEPVQVEAGMRIPDTEYLKQVQALCRRYGTLFVLDEVQTGFHRTGPFLAAHFFGVDPDITTWEGA